MARPRQFDLDAVLDKAVDVFWGQGYEGTSTDDLEAATGLKRGSLYNAFGNKRGLYLAALDRYCRVEMGEAISVLKEREPTLQGLRALFERAINQAGPADSRRGCLLCNTAIELAPRDPEIADRVRAAIDPLRRAIADKLKVLGPHLAADNIEAAADHLASTYMGIRVFDKAGYSKRVLRNIPDHAVKVLTEQ